VTLEQELESVLNKHGADNAANTPDFILAKYLVECLHAFNAATRLRDHMSRPAPRRPEAVG
jgi:hypothetical protein